MTSLLSMFKHFIFAETIPVEDVAKQRYKARWLLDSELFKLIEYNAWEGIDNSILLGEWQRRNNVN